MSFSGAIATGFAMNARVLSLLAMLAGLALLPLAFVPSAHGEVLVFTQLGTDAEGDDREALGTIEDPTGMVGPNVVPAPGADQADIDDVLALSIAATATDVVFRVEVAQFPADAAHLLGTFCWVAAFQVGAGATEYLALGCTRYDASGAGTDYLDAQSTRGTNVVKAMAWATDAPAVLLTVSRADIGAGPGAVLTDIYALTYMGSSLSVDDAAPDAKSDRDALESFGSYALDTGEAVVDPGLPPPYRFVYREATGDTFNVKLEFLPEDWVIYRYNWTSPHDEIRMHCQVSDDAPDWTWSAARPDAADGGDGYVDMRGCPDHGQYANSMRGPLNISISLRAGTGMFNAQIVPGGSSGTTTSSTSPTSTSTTDQETPTSGAADTTTAGTPGVTVLGLLGAVFAGAVVAMRRRL